MKIYKVVTPVTLVQGLISLTDDQARPRLHCLEKIGKKRVFEIKREVTFKVGEVIGLEQVSKAHLPHLLDIEAVAEAEKAADAKAKAEEKAVAEAEKAKLEAGNQ